MMSNKGISIIIPVFNQQKEIENNLKKIFLNNADYQGNFEVIVISDGSNISLDYLAEKYPIKYFNKKSIVAQVKQDILVYCNQITILFFL